MKLQVCGDFARRHCPVCPAIHAQSSDAKEATLQKLAISCNVAIKRGFFYLVYGSDDT